ncbi:unnamed protein product [Gordionus sp. m RMFG-2023]
MDNAFLIPLFKDGKGLILNNQTDIIIGESISDTYSTRENIIHISLDNNGDNNKWLLNLNFEGINGVYLNKLKITPFQSYELKNRDLIYFSKPFLYRFTTDPFKFALALEGSLDESSPKFDMDDYIKNIKSDEIQVQEQAKSMSTSSKSEKHLLNESNADENFPVTKKIKLMKDPQVSINDSQSGKNCQESSTEDSKFDKITIIPDDCLKRYIKSHPILIRSDQAQTVIKSLTDSAQNIQPNSPANLVGLLKSELLAKDELITIMAKTFNLRKEIMEKEKLEWEMKNKKNYEMLLEAKEIQITNLTTKLTMNQKDEIVTKGELGGITEMLPQSKNLESQKMEELVGNKIQLEIDPEEREEYLKNFETSMNAEAVVQKEEMREKIRNVIENDFQCVICKETIIMATAMNCSHTFCNVCLDTWLRTKKECPVCREGFSYKCSVLVLDNFLDNLGEDMFGEGWKDKRNSLKILHEQKAMDINDTGSVMRAERNDDVITIDDLENDSYIFNPEIDNGSPSTSQWASSDMEDIHPFFATNFSDFGTRTSISSTPSVTSLTFTPSVPSIAAASSIISTSISSMTSNISIAWTSSIQSSSIPVCIRFNLFSSDSDSDT